MALHAGERLGPYEILGALGAGGMGEVYRARDTRLGRSVAIKILPPSVSADPSRRRRFEPETRSAGALNHPNILAVHDVGDHEGAPYLVTELLEGETLRERLEPGPMPARKAVDCALQVARGLAATHGKGIVHRDLKPENLFATKDGVVKILDFGLARQTVMGEEEDTNSPTLTRDTAPGVVMGTVGYMSPEQARGETADHRSDLFALGAVLYEMLTGRRAFHKDTSVETLNAILKEEPPEFAEDLKVPPALDRLVRHCLEKKPDDRFQSARDLVYELEGFSGTSEVVGRPKAVAAARRGRGWLAGFLAVLALGAAVAGGFRLGRGAAPAQIPTYRQITFGRGIVSSGRFTPDGKTVVYSASWDDAASPQVYSVRTDSPESKSLGFPPGQVVGVSSKGELALLLTEGSLYPFGPGTLARVPLSGGTPRPVAEGVVCADWAPDGERLAALRSVKADRQIEFPLGTVLARQVSADQPLTCPRFSPRGDRLAFGTSDGYRVLETASGRSFSIKVPEWGHGTWWAWSPDGEEIWFSASDAAEDRPLEAISLSGRRRLLLRIPGAVGLYDVSRDGLVLLEHAFTRVRAFARAPGEVQERELSVFDRTTVADMSADGRRVLLGESGAATGGKRFAYMRQTDGSPPMRLAERGVSNALSPDGRWALATPELWTFGVPKSSGLRVIPVGAGDARDIATPGLRVSSADWVPDGKRILVRGRELEADRGWRIFLFDLEGGEGRAVTPEGVWVAGGIPCDGRRVAALGPTDRVTLYPLEGGEAHEVPGLGPGTVPLRFSGDGASLLVSGPRTTRTAPIRIYRVVLASGARTLLHEINPADMAGVWMPSSPVVTPDGRGYAYDYYQILHSLFLAEGVK